MKNIAIYLLLILVVTFASCEKDNQNEIYDLGTEFLISNNGFSTLDSDVTFTVSNYLNNLTEVEMVDYGTITITDSVGHITLTSDQIGTSIVGTTLEYTFNATYDGKAIQRFGDVTISNPMTLTTPYVWVWDDEGEEFVQESVTVYQNDDVSHIKYVVEPAHCDAETILVETKVGEFGNYTIVTGDFVPAFDSLSIIGSNYAEGDTVYYRFTAANGTHKQIGVLNFEVKKVNFQNMGGAHIGVVNDALTQGFNLVTNEIVDFGTGDFDMTHVVLTSVGFESNNGTLFVATDAVVFENNDIVQVKELYDEGTKESGFANISEGNYFIYKTGDSYGVIKINAVYLTTNGLGDYFEFEYIY